MTPQSKRLRRKVLKYGLIAFWLVYALAFFLGIALQFDVFRETKAGCDRDKIASIASPDGSWTAFVQDEVCSDGVFVTTLDDTVQVVRQGAEPTRENDVFAVGVNGSPDDHPIVEWLSAQRLQITVSNKSHIDFQKNSFEGVDVAVRFDPDDPIERQKWLNGCGKDPKYCQ